MLFVILQGILWSVFGSIIYREKLTGQNTPRILSFLLYWVGVPLQIFFLSRRSSFEEVIWLPPLVTVMVLLLGLGLATFISSSERSLAHDFSRVLIESNSTNGIVRFEIAFLVWKRKALNRLSLPISNSGKGSFVISSILGNTGFMGLALIPPLVSQNYWSWIVLYGIVHNVLGSYGLGVLVSDYFSYSENHQQNNLVRQLQKLLFLPSLWAFLYGYSSRGLLLPEVIETVISKLTLLVIPGAFILIGMQLTRLKKWQNLQAGIFPALIKMIVLPGITGLILTCFGLTGDARLVLVLMSGMPTAFATIILAEAYDLDSNITASSTILSTLLLPATLFLWLTIY